MSLHTLFSHYLIGVENVFASYYHLLKLLVRVASCEVQSSVVLVYLVLDAVGTVMSQFIAVMARVEGSFLVALVLILPFGIVMLRVRVCVVQVLPLQLASRAYVIAR